MAKIIIKLFLVLLLFVTFSNCTEDNNLMEDAAVNKNITNYRISKLNSKQVFDNDLVYESLSRFYPKEERLVTNKLIHNSEYGFLIDTDNVKYVEDVTNNSHSYNFKITRDNPENDNLENLLIMSTTDGGYLSYIVDYGFTSDELETIDETSLISRTTKYAPIDFDLGTFDAGTLNKMTVELVCVETYTWGTLPNDSGELNGDTPVFTQGWIFQSQECTWLHSGGGGGESDGGFGNDTIGSGGGNSSNSGSDYGDPTYDPSDPTIHGNGGIISAPNDEEEECVADDEAIITELEGVFGVGNVSIECNLGNENIPVDLQFNNIADLQDFWDAYLLSKQNMTVELETTITDNNQIDGPQVTQHFKFYHFPYTVFNFYIKQQLGSDLVGFSDYSVLNVTSEISGLTLFDDWHQTTFNNNIESYNSITDVFGKLSLKVFFKGWVVPISDVYHFKMITNATDGSVISQSWID